MNDLPQPELPLFNTNMGSITYVDIEDKFLTLLFAQSHTVSNTSHCF